MARVFWVGVSGLLHQYHRFVPKKIKVYGLILANRVQDGETRSQSVMYFLLSELVIYRVI